MTKFRLLTALVILLLMTPRVNAQTVPGIQPTAILDASGHLMYSLRNSHVWDKNSYQIVGDFYGDGIKGEHGPGESVIRDWEKNPVGYLLNTKRVFVKGNPDLEYIVLTVDREEIGYITCTIPSIWTIKDVNHLIVGHIKFNTVTDKNYNVIGYIGNSVMNTTQWAAVLFFFYRLSMPQ
jgi:hypothetical protein